MWPTAFDYIPVQFQLSLDILVPTDGQFTASNSANAKYKKMNDFLPI